MENKIEHSVPVSESSPIEEDVQTLEPVTLTMNKGDVECYYSGTSTPDLRDIFVFVREHFPNPWQRVILNTNIGVSVKSLEELLIYVAGQNDDKVNELRGLSASSYCPIFVSNDNTSDDYGIHDAIARYQTEYNIKNFEILIYGKDQDALTGAWEYIQNHGDITQGVYFPLSFTDNLKLFTDGLDIAPYAKRLSEAAAKNSLTSKFLNGVMDELREEVKSGKHSIQDFEETRSIYAKWLTMCLTQEFSLPPVYLSSYISEYVALKVAYPFEKLSFYERANFVKSLPQHVGYIGLNQEFKCLYNILTKVYPNPAIAFRLDDGAVLTEDLDTQFAFGNLTLFDYRGMFPRSKEYFVQGDVNESAPSAEGLATAQQSIQNMEDREADARLVEMFNTMTEAANLPDVFMSVRNTVWAQALDGRQYVLYYTEPFGLFGTLNSEYFGAQPYAIYEDEFYRLIDPKIILADGKRQQAATVEEGNATFQQIMLVTASQFSTAIPTFLLMCSELSRYLATDMSYYDKRLRCDRNIMPIITHADSKLCDKNTVFSHVDLLSVRADPVATGVISAFGTLNSDAGRNFLSKIPVSTETFRGCSLL